MSQETQEWLNTQTLIGFTEKRGNAWHYQAELQGEEPNHYEGPVPVADVERRLFDFKVEAEPIYVERDGLFVPVSEKRAWSASDNGDVLGIFSDGYEGHQYREWLVENVSSILDDELGIGSAGLLKNRAQAWVSVEVPENITTPEGVEFRPNLVAATSFDGSLATTYTRTVTNVVCDNTLAVGLSGNDQKFRVKHTRYSGLRIADAREALAVVYEIADDFAAEVAKLTAQVVKTDAWKRTLDAVVPVADPIVIDGKVQNQRGRTIAENKRAELEKLYNHDVRVAPWAGTAFGVLQAFNTYEHHIAGTKGRTKAERNRSSALTGAIAKKDSEVLKVLATVAA